MLKTYKIGKYDQGVKLMGNDIIDVYCTCRYGTIHRDHWKAGKQICKHIKEVLKKQWKN